MKLLEYLEEGIMSGGIFYPGENLDSMDESKRNPLLCYLCNEHYEDPCLLKCFHSFCAKCLRGRGAEGKMKCPLCGIDTILKDDQSLPASDSLLKFLVESSSEDRAQCANCDACSTQMFYCNTCCQPLCEECREETHRARMFSCHEIVPMTKRTKDIHKRCALHSEPYIMFSTDTKAMLCINCFRDMTTESRSYCIDIETAHNQGCKKLDESVQTIRELQSSVQDGIILMRALIEEIKANLEREKDSIKDLYSAMQEKIGETKEILLEEADRQYQNKQKVFREQLTALNTLLPTLHVNLVTCAAFTSSANKYEFLDLAYKLMSRLRAIARLQHPISPLQSSMIYTDFKAEFARCLEGLLSFKPLRDSPSVSMVSSTGTNGGSVRFEIPVTSVGAKTPTTSTMPLFNSGVRRNLMNSNKQKLMEKEGIFAEHCKEFNVKYQEINQKFEKLKTQVQETHRDMTLRRCLIKKCLLNEILEECSQVEAKVAEQFDLTEQKRPTLEKHWEDTFQRVQYEQEIYQAQMSDLIRLKQENQHLVAISKRLEPFLKSITDVTERISPKRGDGCKNSQKADQMHALMEEIHTITPDSQQRVDAIRITQEERQSQIANRTNPMDDALIKTKGLLKAPSERKEIGKKKDRIVAPKTETGSEEEMETVTVESTMVKSVIENSAFSQAEWESPVDIQVEEASEMSESEAQGKSKVKVAQGQGQNVKVNNGLSVSAADFHITNGKDRTSSPSSSSDIYESPWGSPGSGESWIAEGSTVNLKAIITKITVDGESFPCTDEKLHTEAEISELLSGGSIVSTSPFKEMDLKQKIESMKSGESICCSESAKKSKRSLEEEMKK
ncbi:RING finger protein 207-like [Lingula anatina]|uniref:RING finger protein 207 n=1 Tax=Lingula anatina TaxID=7574 RepID=A0A1S3HIT9_LINAN|nr:RING finger protein 207-like [Lingula anatina]|eukprot:XP_013386035.1 RING finger protein 207-like [Lingula anatina]